MTEDYDCPCKKADPDHFLTNEQVKKLLDSQDNFVFNDDDYLSVYNCIHCNDCGTSEERFALKQKYLKDGNQIEGLENAIKTINKYGSPFSQNKSRMKKIEGIKAHDDTLLYLGCFTTVKTPRYGEDVVEYLVKTGISFTILKEEICCGYPILCNGAVEEYKALVQKNRRLFKEKHFKRIITACPSCYMVFKKEYSEIEIEIKYFTEFLKPIQEKKKGNLVIQHACPLRNGEIPNIVKDIEVLYEKSGYNILKNIPLSCSGGGVGHQLRTDIVEAIALKRMDDFSLSSIPSNNPSIKENFITTYCPDAYWIIKVFGKKKKIPFQLKHMCELLTD